MRQPGLSRLVAACGLTRCSGRRLLLAGAAVAAVWVTTGSSAAAQAGAGRLKAPSAPLPDDGLGPKDLLLQADELIQDQPNHTVTATGHVQARYQGKVLRADRLDYDTQTGVAHAVGHAVIINPDGTTNYGDDVLLDDQFRAAVAIGFAAREQGNATLAAGAAVRRNETVNQLNNAVFTNCNICADDGSPKTPSWRIEATRITQDHKNGVIYYKNAVVKVLGIPVFYAPVFWHPDPSIPRRSGLLAPVIEYSKRRGLSIQQPYLLTLGPSTDLQIAPQINTRVNPLLNLRYTERFYSGMIDIRAGYSRDANFDNDGKFGNVTNNSYLLARGLFNIDPNWVWGFGAERVSDPTLFARYNVRQVYQDRGPFPADTDRLVSQLYTVHEDTQSYVSVAAMDFESLRAFGVDANGHEIVESTRAFPVVAPLIEARWAPTQDILGGQLKTDLTTVALTRNSPVISIYDPTGVTPQGPQEFNSNPTSGTLAQLNALAQRKQISALEYTSSRRASADIDWRTTLITNGGIRIEPFVYGRADAYSIDDAKVYNASSGTLTPGKSDVERLYGTIGATVSYPFIKPMGDASLVVEPIAQVAASPTYRVNPNIPNEDSVAFELDETNLFEANRFTGDDLLEGGERLNVGGRATLDWGVGHNAELTAGRVFRAQSDPQFTALSGVAGTASDWVVAFTTSPITGLTMYTRSRLDADSYALRYEEAGVNYGTGDNHIGTIYEFNENGLSQTPAGVTQIGKTEDITVYGQAFITRHWGVSANVTRDMQDLVFPSAQVGLIYRDECIRVDILYTHDETFGSTIGDSNSVSFRITLATLGNDAPLNPSNSGRTAR